MIRDIVFCSLLIAAGVVIWALGRVLQGRNYRTVNERVRESQIRERPPAPRPTKPRKTCAYCGGQRGPHIGDCPGCGAPGPARPVSATSGRAKRPPPIRF